MSQFNKVDSAFNFLKSVTSFSTEELVTASQWKESTVKGYLTKKLSPYITKKGNKFHINDNFKAVDSAEFRSLFKQSINNQELPENAVPDNNPTSLYSLKNLLKIKATNPLTLDISSETDQIECKESFSKDFKSLLKPVASFLNNKGGYILYGIKDQTWEVVGLSDAGLNAFKSLDIKDVNTEFLNATNVGIEIEKKEYQIENKNIGVLYIYPAKKKPVIFTKNSEGISFGQIFYRYPAESRLIGTNELNNIIEERTKLSIENDFMKLISLVLKNGIENSAVLNVSTGEIEGRSGNFLIESSLLDKIKFIKEGEFVEKSGAPALKLVGDLNTIANIGVQTKEIETHISITHKDLILSFARQNVTNSQEYIKYGALSQKKWLPIYYFMKEAELDKKQTIAYLESLKTEAGNNYPNQQIELLNDNKKPPKGNKTLNTKDAISEPVNVESPNDALNILVSMSFHNKENMNLNLYLKYIEEITNKYWEDKNIQKNISYTASYLDVLFFKDY